ncbi:hypothetical protein QR680_018010 [Steinernema hermaphroditum]|uniref:7TM GPCR serpentine receptor class x (Srx) domain-containing protein n=1 Tax=Steinernema hermaphroditum TaxID=289476 RepID=A0AA39HHW3_9BILA|nr:hypothetical protein QR680_018010 [Steinernema hermaphroditum]
MIRYVVGAIYLLIGLTALPLHAVLLYIFLSNKKLRSLPSYQLMIQIDIGDCVQVVNHVYTGLMTLTGSNFCIHLEKFFGGFVNAVWISMMLLTFLLAVNRLDVITDLKTGINRTIFYNVTAVLCWLFGLGLFTCYMTPYTGLEYNNDDFYWSFLENGTWNEFVQDAETLSTIPALLTSFILYIIIFITVVAKKRSYSLRSSTISAQELQLILQAFIIFSYKSALICCWHYGDYFLPDSSWTPIAINIMWMVDGVVNPVVYFIINSGVREKLFKMFAAKERTNAVCVSHVATLTTT